MTTQTTKSSEIDDLTQAQLDSFIDSAEQTILREKPGRDLP